MVLVIKMRRKCGILTCLSVVDAFVVKSIKRKRTEAEVDSFKGKRPQYPWSLSAFLCVKTTDMLFTLVESPTNYGKNNSENSTAPIAQLVFRINATLREV